MTAMERFFATGRRKTSVARVILQPGSGRVTINKRAVEDYFPRATHRALLRSPLEVVNGVDKFDLHAVVHGGGDTGQAGAVRLGVSRALEKWDGNLRTILKREGMLTRDSRIKERKKYGQRGARARFQFSKR